MSHVSRVFPAALLADRQFQSKRIILAPTKTKQENKSAKVFLMRQEKSKILSTPTVLIDFKSFFPTIVSNAESDDDVSLCVEPNGAGVIREIVTDLLKRREDTRDSNPQLSKAIKLVVNSFIGAIGDLTLSLTNVRAEFILMRCVCPSFCRL